MGIGLLLSPVYLIFLINTLQTKTTEIYKKQAKKKNKNAVKSKDFIFQMIFGPSFWSVFTINTIVSLFTAGMPKEVGMLLLIVVQGVVMYLIPENIINKKIHESKCAECGAMWSYELIKQWITDEEEHQETKYIPDYNIVKKQNEERLFIVQVKTYILHQLYKCSSCGKEHESIQTVSEESGGPNQDKQRMTKIKMVSDAFGWDGFL